MRHALGVDELLALWRAKLKGRTTAASLAPELQRDAACATNVLAELAQNGLPGSYGETYHLKTDHQPVIKEDLDYVILTHV